MALNLCDYENRACEAVRRFWSTRDQATETQKQRGRSDQGTRSSTTSGKHMDAFAALFVDIAKANGLQDSSIVTSGQLLTLPGFFRPSKNWDLLVMNEGQLIAALEFKSQVGSLGNNANNRAEEVLGLALDLWTAHREGAFGRDAPPPFVGDFFLLEDTAVARRDARTLDLHFPIFAEFHNASYAERYDLLCRKMVQEKVYSAAAVMLAARADQGTGRYTEVTTASGLLNLVSAFAGHIAVEAARSARAPR